MGGGGGRGGAQFNPDSAIKPLLGTAKKAETYIARMVYKKGGTQCLFWKTDWKGKTSSSNCNLVPVKDVTILMCF